MVDTRVVSRGERERGGVGVFSYAIGLRCPQVECRRRAL
jgi:hypothetical protein